MLSESEVFVPVPGGACYVKTWTPPKVQDSVPIVLLHDSLGCVGLWREFPAHLAERLERPAIAYDRLGFGKSSPRQDIPSIEFIQEEAEIHFSRIRDALKLGEYALFGYSVGGGMALTIASNPLSGCLAVVSEAAQAYVEDRTIQAIRDAERRFLDPNELARLEKWHGDKARWVLRAWTEVWQLPEMADWSLREVLPKVECPVLAIHGDRDDFGSLAFPRMITETCSGPSKLVVLNDCGHIPHREQEEQVLEAVENFLRTNRR